MSMCWFQGVYELTKVLLRNYVKIAHVSVELIRNYAKIAHVSAELIASMS